MTTFSDPAAVARYTDGPVRMVPGFVHMQRMAAILLAENAPAQARMLVLGAGGGLELQVLADAQPDWTFAGVDPSAEMLDLARQTAAAHSARIDLYHGYIDTAPAGPFDGATCLLTLHFIPRDDRLATLRALHARLKPGAPLVVAHHSIPVQDRTQWLYRFAAFAAASGAPMADPAQTVATLGARLPILTPDEDQDLMVQAGFTNVSLFYAAFTFRGWVGYAG